MAILNAPFWGGFPWEPLRTAREFFVLTVVALPPGWGRVLSDEGSDIFVPPPGRAQLCFERRGVTVYTPWLPVTVSPMVLPLPRVANAVDTELRVHREPGVVINVGTIRL